MKSAWQPTDFNPRSHEGSDNLFHFVSPNCSISIHAPTRGATSYTGGYGGSVTDFNPRSHEGSDCLRSSCSKNCCISIHAPTRGATNGENRYKRIKQFQSTLPRGERQSHHFLLSSSFSYFNPRSHEGSDSDLVMNIYNRNHFNPRSHEGSDLLHL